MRSMRPCFPTHQSFFMQALLPLFCAGLATTTAPAKLSAAAHSFPKTPTVLVLGDSLSAGYGVRRAEAYPALLSEKAAAAGLDLKVINAGVTGDTTAGALRRLPQLLRQHIDVLLV